MPNNVLRGDAQDQDQICTHTVGGTPAAGQIYTLTCNLKETAYTATADDTTNALVAAGILALLTASSDVPELGDADFSVDGAVITSQSKTPGVPFTFTTSATGTGTFVTATTQTAKGHEHWGDPDNWSLGRIPAGECAPPELGVPTASNGGILTDTGTFYWVVTATNALGETLVSNERSLVIASPNQTANLAWSYVPGATGYKVYRGTVSGNYTNKLRATISDPNTLVYVDNGGAVGAGTPPVSNTALGDDVFLRNTDTSLRYTLPTDYLVLNSLHQDTTHTGEGGLPDQNPAGYTEYRQTYIKAAPKAVYFGENAGVNGGSGSGMFRIDKGSLTSTAFQIYQTGSPAQGLPALFIKGPHADDTFRLQQGDVSIADAPGDTAQFDTLESAYQTNAATDVRLRIGAGCVCGDITMLGGLIACDGNVQSLTMTSGAQGSFYLNGSATIDTVILNGGVYYPKTTGEHGTVKVNNGGTLDHRQDIRAFSINELTISDGCTFLDPAGSIDFSSSNPLVVNGTFSRMTLDFGTNQTWTRNS